MRSRGFTLIEIIVVLAIVGIILSMALSVAKTLQASRATTATTAALQRADDALVAFVMVNKRLPCPANGALAPADPSYGVEQRDGATQDCLGAQANGVVPWSTIAAGVGDLTDGHGGVLTYRVALGLSRDQAMNFTACDQAGAQPPVGASPNLTCAAGCQNQAPPLDAASTCTNPASMFSNRGLKVVATTGGTALADPANSTGAAYVLISHGPNHSGGFTAQGVVQEAVSTVGTDEAQNVATAPVAAFYVDKTYDGTDTATHFDDVLSRPTIAQIAIRAGTDSRAHR